MKKLFFAAAVLVMGFIVTSTSGLAHHGWRWTTGGNIDLTGVIQKASLGMPHGVLQVNAEGEVWTVEVGQPWRNERAGLKPGDMVKGVEIRIVGEPSADTSKKRMKAERVYIRGREYNLYPGRD